MYIFTITQNEYLQQETTAYYHQIYTTFGTDRNPDFINFLKNQFNNEIETVLQQSSEKLIKILNSDLLRFKYLLKNINLTVCVIPRAKSESFYSEKQKLFKRIISDVVDKIDSLANGTNYILRHTDTITTHMYKSGYGGEGDLPYVGITLKTCNISDEVYGKDILLIDDIYTEGVNIDEDAIQALLNKGAKSVTFYSIAKTYKGGKERDKHPTITLDFGFQITI